MAVTGFVTQMLREVVLRNGGNLTEFTASNPDPLLENK